MSDSPWSFLIAQQAAKDTGYSLIVIAGVAALGGLCYLMLRELYSRETPNGIYKEASKLCLASSEVKTRTEIRLFFDSLTLA